MSFDPYEYRNDTVALAAAIERIAELELEIEWRKGYEVDLLQRHNDLRKLVAAYEKLRRFQHVSGAIESVFCDIDALMEVTK